MLNMRDIKVDVQETVGAPLFLVKEAPTFAYENGTPTQRVDGTRYTVACPGAGMQTLAVKVPGPQTLTRGDRAIVPVAFDNMEIYVYYRDGKPMIGARAAAIRTCDGPEVDKGDRK